MSWVQRLDRRGRIEAVPFQNARRRSDLGLTETQCQAAAWTVHPDGSRHRGHAAILDALGVSVGWPALVRAAYLPLASNLMAAAYDWVARNRHRLPGQTPHCREHPEDC